MRFTLFFLIVSLLAGCSGQPVTASRIQPLRPIAISMAPATKVVETRYEVRSYREGSNPSLRHEAHAVFRATRVPLSVSEELARLPRDSFPPASLAPLPLNSELAAELATQRQVSAELKTLQEAMADLEQRMRTQYRALVKQSEETVRVREELETKREQTNNAPADTAKTGWETPAAKW